MAEGAASFLLSHLSVLLNEKQHLLGGLKREVEYIQDEMMRMREFLRVADANEDGHVNLKEWIRQLREISYDVEDVLDKYMLQLERERGTSGFCECIEFFYSSIMKLIAQLHIASEIQAINHRLENVSKSRQRYREMCGDVYPSSSTTIRSYKEYDGRGDALFLEEADVVGIEKPKKQLIEWIGSMNDGREVISVVGMGGLGKTTLVKKVYDDELVKKRFDQHVWVVASDYSDVKNFLAKLIKKLVGEIQKAPPHGLEEMSVDEMRHFIYEFLKDKKYIIVLDDVWKISMWDDIKPALPKRGVHGCVIVTTRFNYIGDVVCTETHHVYNLQPLPIQASEALFLKNAFPMKSCPHNLTKLIESILRRCQGLPLAIVVIGGLLATKDSNVEEWEMFSRSLGHELGEDGSLWKIFSLSYNDLPWYLKHCYLYLSIFPEDELLEKEKIIRLWIAEGFVQSKQHKTMEEVAGGYLNELLSRSLIQVARRDVDGRPRAFRIHDLLRDYIISKSREHNIVTICHGWEMQWPSRIRRFSIQKSFSFSQETYNFECLRSLILMCSENMDMEIINELVKKCRLLKVLDLRGAPLETIPEGVFKLYHLKYLCLRNTMVSVIPKSIGSLQKLETLDLKNCNVTELPTEIQKLHKLQNLLVYKYKYKYKSTSGILFGTIQSCKAPCNIGSCLPFLVKLSCIDANESDGVKMVREIGKLTQLRRLGIVKLRSEDGKELCSSIAKLTNLRSLRIDSVEEGEKLELEYSVSLPFLRTLEVYGWLERIPEWIASLEGLTTLQLYWSRLSEDPLKSLENLSNLSHLTIHGAYIEGLSFKARGFQKLKELRLLDLKLMKGMSVEKGCMPFLEGLYVRDCPMLIEPPQGLQHLINLRYIQFTNMKKEFVENVEGAAAADWRPDIARVVFLTTSINGKSRVVSIL